MSLTPNYNPNSLAPKIIITNNSDVTQYTFEPKYLFGSPTNTLGNLSDLELSLGINDNFGICNFVVQDHDNNLTDGTIRARCNIQRQHNVQLYLGKTSGTLQRWFYGKIFDTDVIRPGTNQQAILVQCVGWGVVLRERDTRMIRNQAKTSDGITLDSTDVNTKLYQLIKDVIQKRDHYLDENISLLSTITVNGVCDTCLDFNIANLNETYNTFAGTIQKLAASANTVWGVDWDRDLFVRDPAAHDSQFLFTNNLSAFRSQNWTSTKIAYLKKAPIVFKDSSLDGLYSFLHFYGPFNSKLDVKYEVTPDATNNADDVWHAIPIVPTVDNIAKVAVRVNRTGTPANNWEIEIRGDDGTGKPDPTDVRRHIVISKHKIQALGTTTPSPWLEIPLTDKLEITPNEQLFIVLRRNGDVTNTVNIDYKSGTGTYYDSPDGVTWTVRTGAFNYRVYYAKRMLTTVEVIEAENQVGIRERLFPVRADLELNTVIEAAKTAGAVLGRERRSYEDIIISCPTDRIPLGKFCYIEDQFNGLNMKANIVGLKLEMHSKGDSHMGAEQITLQLDDYYK